jgi:hypothetical protein
MNQKIYQIDLMYKSQILVEYINLYLLKINDFSDRTVLWFLMAIDVDVNVRKWYNYDRILHVNRRNLGKTNTAPANYRKQSIKTLLNKIQLFQQNST